jgi:integrase/recombinase XerD
MQNETNVKQLILFCREEMEMRDYSEDYKCRVSKAWDALDEWMDSHHIDKFSPEIGNTFLDEKVGTHLSGKDLIKSQRVYVRAIRMIISLHAKGYVEEHSPTTEHIFTGALGKLFLHYLDYLTNVLKRKKSTVSSAEYYLFLFYSFLVSHRYEINDISFDIIESFHSEQGYSLPTQHNSAGIIRRFLRFLYQSGISERDYGIYVAPDNYRIREGKLPSTYTEEEIRKVLSCIDRSSAIGKRDYLILILAAEYGWRNSDIRHFRLDHIDWDRNEIRFCQDKTGKPVSFPLFSSVGNAIIDYLKNGRPLTDAPEVILSVEPSRKSKPLSASRISSIAENYFGKSGLSALNTRHMGTHAFRHSLASNMLSREVPLPIISGILGHSTTESTKTYLKVDYRQLKRCALPMPVNHSPFYKRGGIWV